MKRKKCKREVKRTLKQIGWAAPKAEFMRREDVTKLWLAAKCGACVQCPRLAAKLARWRIGTVPPR